MRKPVIRCCVALATLLALAISGCSSGAEASGVLRAREVSGGVEVRNAEGAWEALGAGRELKPGEEVRTGTDGHAVLSSSAGSFELAPSAWIIVRAAESVVARQGHVLVSAQRTSRLDDESGLSVTARAATFRLDVGRRVVVYRGTARAAFPGRSLEVGAGREVTLGLVNPDVHAIAVDDQDPWDVRLLADAIEIDRALRPYQRTFDANTAAEPKSLAFFGRYVQADAIGFIGPLLGSRLSSFAKLDVLVALYVAIERSAAQGNSLQAAFDEVLLFREEGASFGLAAQVLGVGPEALLRRLVAGLTPGAPPQPVENPGGRNPGETPGPSPSRTPGPGPSQSPTNEPSPTPTPTEPSPTPTGTGTCSAIDQLLGRCGSPPPTPGLP